MKYELNRFKSAQANCYPQVLEEMKRGCKTSHWMWFIFPQIAGLGSSEMSKKFEIASLEEAECYLMDELLSARLIELTQILAYEIEGKTAEQIFGFPDHLKFHSSMTLFYCVVRSGKQYDAQGLHSCFEDAIRKYFEGRLEEGTLGVLNEGTFLK